MSLNINGFSSNAKINATVLDQQKDVSKMLDVQKNSFTHSLLFKILTFGLGALIVGKMDAAAESAANRLKNDVTQLVANLDTMANANAVSMANGGGPFADQTITVNMSGETVTLHQTSDGKLYAKMKDSDEEHLLDSTVEQLRQKLADDIFSNVSLFSKEQLRTMLPARGNDERAIDNLSTEASFRRSVYENVIKSFTSLSADEFQNVTTENLQHLAKDLLSDEGLSEDNIKARIDEYNNEINAEHVSSSEAQTLVSSYREQMTSGVAKGKVTILPTEPKKDAPPPEDSKLKSLRELCADIVFNEDIDQDVGDVSTKNPGERLRQVMSKHIDALVELGKVDDIKALGFDADVTEILGEIKDAIPEGYGKDDLSEMFNSSDPIVLIGVQMELSGVEDKIATKVASKLKDVQEDFNKGVDDVFKNSGSKIENVKQMKGASINKLMDDASSPDSGYGLFMKNVMKKYFSNSSLVDQRSMVAAAIRYGFGVKSDGEKLGAMLKGAGPLMQKMLQGLDANKVGVKFAPVVKDMKKNLAPIPEEVVKASMLDIVNRSGGKISNITVVKSLGRASVGEAFHCKVSGPGYPASGKDVVVKILRPDALQKINRESSLFIAESKNPEVKGMEFTFKDQLESIKKELDFTLEDANIKTGELYDKGYERVKSVKTLPVVHTSPGCLIMEMAPGSTVDGFLEDTKKEIKAIKESITPGDNHKISTGDVKKAITDLTNKYNELAKRQKDLCDLATKWVTEGLYGKGFFHGDLHAGNIMVAEQGLTVIDFGNVTQLTETQKSHITAMMAAAGVTNNSDPKPAVVDSFMNHFEAMLSASGKEQFAAHRQEINDMLGVVLGKGSQSDTGRRIFVALNYIQRMGVEVPGAVFKFSQSQIRLQNTIDAMNSQMSEIKSSLKDTIKGSIISGNQFTLPSKGDPSSVFKDNFESQVTFLQLCLTDGKYGEVEDFLSMFAKDDPVGQKLRKGLDDFKKSNVLANVQTSLRKHFQVLEDRKDFTGDIGGVKAFIDLYLKRYAGVGGLNFDEKGNAFITRQAPIYKDYVSGYEDLPVGINFDGAPSNGWSLKDLNTICQRLKEKLVEGYDAHLNLDDPEVFQVLSNADLRIDTIDREKTLDFINRIQDINELVEAQKMLNSANTNTDAAQKLAKEMTQSGVDSLKSMLNTYNGKPAQKVVNANSPDDFCDRMGTVVTQNLTASLKRVDTSIVKMMV